MNKILNNVSLKPYNTFGIDVQAASFVCINNIDDLMSLLKAAHLKANLIIFWAEVVTYCLRKIIMD
jgi:UDP-N-acetylmuramate dehydrogenase